MSELQEDPQEIAPENPDPLGWDTTDLRWIRGGNQGDGVPSIDHPRVQHSAGGGMCPEQHYGILVDGRFFYLRYRHGEASLQVIHKTDGVYDLPATHPEWDSRVFHDAMDAGEEYHGPPFFAEPKVWVSVSQEDDGFFSSQEELLETFSKCLDLVDEYDREYGITSL